MSKVNSSKANKIETQNSNGFVFTIIAQHLLNDLKQECISQEWRIIFAYKLYFCIH